MTAVAHAQTVAVVAVKDLQHEFTSYWRPQVFSIDQRAARMAASSYLEGHEQALRQVADMLGLGYYASIAFCQIHAATYTELRNWLHGDLEFDYRVACQVALSFTAARERRRARAS